jgi:hypothetical protein
VLCCAQAQKVLHFHISSLVLSNEFHPLILAAGSSAINPLIDFEIVHVSPILSLL